MGRSCGPLLCCSYFSGFAAPVRRRFRGNNRFGAGGPGKLAVSNPVLKTIGAAYLTSFGVQISREAGEEAISGIIELAGKLVILLIALPLIQAILHTLFGILGVG